MSIKPATMLALVALLSLASHGAAGLDLGCDNLCHLRGVWLSCRLHIHWSKNHEYKNDLTACHSAHEHVLSACLPHCSGCAVESLGAGCANEATTTVTNTTATTTTTAATTTTKATATTTRVATTTSKAATPTNTTTSKTAFSAAVEPITETGDSANETAGSYKRGASALNASKSERHPAVMASRASSVKHSPIEIRNSSADATDAAIDTRNLPSTTRGTSENISVNGTAGKSIRKIPDTNHSNEIPSHAKSSNKSNNRTAGHIAAGAPAARNTSSNRTTPHFSKTKATSTKTITSETSAALETIEKQNGTAAEVASVSELVDRTAFAKKHEVGARLTARVGVIAMVVPSALALTALLGWLAARRGWLTYSGRPLTLGAMAEGGRPEEADAQFALMQPAPGEAEFMSSP